MYKLLVVFIICLYSLVNLGCSNKTASVSKHEEKINGVCTYVNDGDTIRLMSENKNYKVRLNKIDAPEISQSYGVEAKKILADLCLDKKVDVVIRGKDKYGRLIGEIWIHDKNINAEMLSQGAAWHYKRYDKTKQFAELERQAQKRYIGLWKDPEPMAPWDYRKMKRNQR